MLQCVGKQIGNYMMKMLVILTLRHYDLVPLGGCDDVRLPLNDPRSVSTSMPDRDIEVTLVRRKT